MHVTEFDCPAITRGQRLALAPATLPHRTDGMNYVPRRQSIGLRDFSITRDAAMERPALGEQFGACRAVDRAIDAPAAQQRTIRSADDRVNAQACDISEDDFKPRCADLARGDRQAEAAALMVTPFSESNCCSSPAWNISRTMSQPPMNSPLT
jgi:hypothetical protein